MYQLTVSATDTLQYLTVVRLSSPDRAIHAWRRYLYMYALAEVKPAFVLTSDRGLELAEAAAIVRHKKC